MKIKNFSLKFNFIYSGIFALLIIFVLCLSQGTIFASSLDQLQAQNTTLENQINSANQTAKQLASQANTIQNQLGLLNIQISQIQDQIALTENKIAELQVSLNNAQNELNKEKGLLKASLQALYKTGGVSTVELLIGSDSFTQFVNNQTYLEQLKDDIQTSAEKVIGLKQQIQAQQTQEQSLLGQQQGQQIALQNAQSNQQNLLDQTQGQESAYQSMVSSLKQQQQQVLAQIAAQINTISYGDGSNGGYPAKWADVPQDSVLDNWGMYNRECVSYAAFRVAASGRNMPAWGYTALGNAKDWLTDAAAAGIPFDRNPQPGDVAIATFAPYGHAMYVESVSGRTVFVSQYNFSSPGAYSEMSISADNSSLGVLYFIHFP